MNQRNETVEEYLRRGKTITKIPKVLNTVGSIWNQLGYKIDRFSELENVRSVSWKSVQPDERFDTEDDDRKYWNKLNKRCDKLLKKIRKNEKKT